MLPTLLSSVSFFELAPHALEIIYLQVDGLTLVLAGDVPLRRATGLGALNLLSTAPLRQADIRSICERQYHSAGTYEAFSS
jgi:hypothetical protein